MDKHITVPMKKETVATLKASAIQWPLFIHNFFTAPEYPAFLLHFKGVFPLLQKLLEVFPLHALKHICAVLREIAALLAQSIQLLHHINEGGKRDHLHVAIFHRHNLGRSR